MDETQAHLITEIHAIRAETAAIVDELEQRLHETTDIRRQAQRHRWLFVIPAVLTIGFVTLVSFQVRKLIAARRERKSNPGQVLQETLERLRVEATDRVRPIKEAVER